MVTNNYSWEEQTRRVLADTQAEIVAIGNQLSELQQKYQTLKTEADAYETALHGFLRRSGRHPVDLDWNVILTNAKTHKERIRLIAEHFGTVRPIQLTDILYPIFIKSKKRGNAYQIVQTNLADMVDAGIMEKSVSGDYKFIGFQQKLPVN